MSDFNDIINWDNVFKGSYSFKNDPAKFGFVENVFKQNFYDKLYSSYPKEDDGHWYRLENDYSRSAMRRNFGKKLPNYAIDVDDDPSLSEEWNLFHRYLLSAEFVENMSKYSGIKLKRVNAFSFINLHKGDFNLPHNHFSGFKHDTDPYKITILMYFTKGWKKGDPGGTYMCENEDESTIIFEPYHLDNSMMCFAESPKAWHGSRIIVKDVIRQSIQFTIQ